MKRYIHMTPNSVLVGPKDPEAWEVAIVLSRGCEQALNIAEKQDIAAQIKNVLDKKQRQIVAVMPIVPIILKGVEK